MKKNNESIPKNSIECQYKGYKMRSLLEMRVGKLLDKLQIKWSYEPKHFSLNNAEVNYLPDFKIKNTDLFIEAKGVYQEKDEEKVKTFAKETDKEILLISADNASYVRSLPNQEVEYSKVNLINCSNCSKYSFVPDLGTWSCRNCGNHNGDRDIEVYHLFSEDHYRKKEPLKLENEETIEKWLTEVEKQ